MVGLNEYLEGKVGQQVHYPNVLRPESLPKRLQTRRLQAITGQVPVRETIMRWYRHKGYGPPGGVHEMPLLPRARNIRALHAV